MPKTILTIIGIIGLLIIGIRLILIIFFGKEQLQEFKESLEDEKNVEFEFFIPYESVAFIIMLLIIIVLFLIMR